MDSNTVFVRTSKGEDEAHSRTTHLPGDIRRALLVVDGIATFGELSKRAAPSLRASLGAMLEELEKGGYIRDKSEAVSPPIKMAFKPKMAVPPKLAVPPKRATPATEQPEDEAAVDLDFTATAAPAVSSEGEVQASQAAADDAERLKTEAEEKARLEAERLEALQAARAREEAEREKQRFAAEAHAREEAARRAAAEATRVEAEEALAARFEAEAKALQQEAARKAEQEAADRIARKERETAVLREEAGKGARQEAAEKAAEPPSAQKAEAFTFEAFQLEETEVSPPRHEPTAPEAKAQPPEAGPAGKAEPFVFDSFQVDTQQPVEQLKKEEPRPAPRKESKVQAEKPGEARPVTPVAAEEEPPAKGLAGKAESFVFDAFQVDTQQPVEQPKKAAAKPPPRKESKVQAEKPREAHPPTSLAAEEKPPVTGPSEEEMERVRRERIETERRLREEELAEKKQAEAREKAHAEARRRAEEAARKQFEQAAMEIELSEKAAHAGKAAQVVHPRRKPVTGGRVVGFMLKVGLALVLLLLGILLAAPYVVPTRDYIPVIEKLLSARLNQPVRIGSLSGRILPTARLELGDVQIGKAGQLEAKLALIDFAFRGLVIEAKPVDSVELQGARVSGAGLQNVSVWLRRMAADEQYPVASIVFSQGVVDAGAVRFTDVEGTLNFGKIGEFANASLSANGGKYMVGMEAGLADRVNIDIKVRDSNLPLLPDWHFDELTAEGELTGRGMTISGFHGRLLDGFLDGSASLDWRSGWVVQGTLAARAISMQRLNSLLNGSVEGSARFRMSAGRLDALADSAVLDGSFTSGRGVVNGVDIIETARTFSTEHLPGGRTHFDELSGDVSYADRRLHLKQVRITSNVLDATATLDIRRQQVSGSVVAKVAIEEGAKPVTMKVEGTVDRPTLRFVR